MPRPHIALLDGTRGDAHAQRNFKHELDATLTIFRVSDGEIPQSLAPADEERPSDAEDLVPPYEAVVITGSQQVSAYSDEPWIAELTTWLREAIAAGLPVLGVCWGHLFLAQLLGGTVTDRGKYELGYVEIEQTRSDRLFEGLPNPFVAFAMHFETVTALPDAATPLARNNAGLQAFRQDRIYGVQFHPEYDMRTAEDMVRRRDLSMHAIQQALNSITPEHVKAAQVTKKLFGNFVRFVQEIGEERLRKL